MRVDLAPGDDIAALVRVATDDSLVIVLPQTMDALSAAQAEASIGPLAVERAPGMRINAVIAGDAADAVDAAAAYLERARSTTGQVIRLV